MQLTEFKAWFEGYTEAMKGPPSVKQWDRIKARIAEIDGTPITHSVFIDRYLTTYYTPTRPYYMTSSGQTYTSTGVFNSAASMYALGKTEAGAVS